MKELTHDVASFFSEELLSASLAADLGRDELRGIADVTISETYEYEQDVTVAFYQAECSPQQHLMQNRQQYRAGEPEVGDRREAAVQRMRAPQIGVREC